MCCMARHGMACISSFLQGLHTVLSLLPAFRPYRDLHSRLDSGKGKGDSDDDDAAFDLYVDQLTLVFNLVHVLSSYGELR